MQLKLMYGDNLARRWGEVSPMVDQALLHGSGSVSTYGLFLQCVTEDAQCWIDEDEYGQIKGVAITRFEFLESTKLLAIVVTTCEDWFVGGPEVLELFEEFALDTAHVVGLGHHVEQLADPLVLVPLLVLHLRDK